MPSAVMCNEILMKKIDVQSFILKLEDVFDTVDRGTVRPEVKFRDLADWTSLNAMVLVALFETEFDRPVSFDQLRQCETIQDLYNLI